MKYITIDNTILNGIDTSDFQISTWGCYNFKTSILTLVGQKDKFVNGQYPKEPIVTNFDIKKGTKEVVINSLVYDCVWNENLNELIYNAGNTIQKYSPDSKKTKKLYKFTNIKYAPINPSISPDNNMLAYLKFKSSKRIIQVLNLETCENLNTKISCSTYHWMDNDNIIYSTSSGNIKILNISTKKFRQTPINLKLLTELKNKNTENLRKRVLELDEKKQSWTQFQNPKIHENRIYFLISSGASKTYSVSSVNKKFKDFRVEHLTSKSIRRYWFIGQNLCVEENGIVNFKDKNYSDILNNSNNGLPIEIGIITNSYHSDNQISIIKATNNVQNVNSR